jgi:CrcB protein
LAWFKNSPPRRDFLINLVLISIGGILGSLIRYVFSEVFVNQYLAVFVANILGVFVAAAVYKNKIFSEQQKLLWVTGFAGGLTTFSSIAVLSIEASFLGAALYLSTTYLITFVVLIIVRKRVSV